MFYISNKALTFFNCVGRRNAKEHENPRVAGNSEPYASIALDMAYLSHSGRYSQNGMKGNHLWYLTVAQPIFVYILSYLYFTPVHG